MLIYLHFYIKILKLSQYPVFILCTINYIDISLTLSFFVYHGRTISSIDPAITQLAIPNWTCNESNFIYLDLSRFISLFYINIGDDCFGSVKTFKIDGLNQLKTIKIGKNSFTQKKIGIGNDKSKSFHILNCESLESIQIGEYSFSDFAGDFELKNLPQLRYIQIGTIKKYSNNFQCSSFVIRGIDMMSII